MQRRMNNPNSLTSHFIAGSVAGFAQCIICSPMELAKTRMQVQGQGESLSTYRHTTHTYKGPVDCIHKIYKTEGIRGVCRGMWFTIVRETPSFGVYFATYEYICRLFQKKDQKVGTGILLMAGGFAGMASWLCTYPVDVVKSRFQADMRNEYKGFWDCCIKSYKAEGLAVFGKGLGSTLLRAFPVNAATFTTVEMVLRYCKDKGEDDGSYDLTTYSNMQEGSAGILADIPSTDSAQAHPSLPVVATYPSHP